MAATFKYRMYSGLVCLVTAMGLVGQAASISAPIMKSSSPTHVGQRLPRSAEHGIRTREMVRTEAQPSGASDILATLPDPSDLKPATTAERDAAKSTILAQLNAFRDGDFEKADGYQVNSLRANFGSTQQFRATMSQVYPEFTAYKTARFGNAKSDKAGRVVVVPVTLTGQDEVTVQALYLMEQSSGGYRVLTVLGGMNPHPAIDNPTYYRMT